MPTHKFLSVIFLYFVLTGRVLNPTVSVRDSSTAGETFKKQILVAKENYNNGNYTTSIRDAVPVYQYAQRHQDQRLLADAGNLIGLIYLAQNNQTEAMKYFRQAESVNKEIGDNDHLAANYLNISLVLCDQKLLDSAIIYATRCLVLSQTCGIRNLAVMAKNHLGDYYFRQSKMALAEQEFMAVLNDPNFQSDWENSFASTGLSQIRSAQKRFKEAAGFAVRAFDYAQKAGAKWDAARALDLAQQAEWAIGDARSAYQHLRLFKLYNDSLSSVEKDKDINKLLLTEKSLENERLLGKTQISDQKNKINQLIIAIISLLVILLLCIAVGVYRRVILAKRENQKLQSSAEAIQHQNKSIEKQNEGLHKLNEDKNQLFSIISHDLRSPFAAMQSTLSLFKSGDLDNEEMLVVTAALEEQVGASAHMLDDLLLWASNQLSGIARKEVEIDLVAKVAKITGVLTAVAKRKQVTLTHQDHTSALIKGDADQIRIMIQNLVSNAIKFTPEGGQVVIRYLQHDDTIDLIIEDNGVGIAPEVLTDLLSGSGKLTSTYGTAKEKGVGLGMQLVKDFAAQNGVGVAAKS
ncbi:Signal transduction histidine kinase, partial [Mucilaginibacter pineti]